MFLAVIALTLLAGFLAFWQYSSPLANGNVTAPAETYAQNMIIWHQAAMLQVAQHNKDYKCADPLKACLIDLNAQIYDESARAPLATNILPVTGGPAPALATNWPGYRPLFVQTKNTGWHSFLIRGYDLVNPVPAAAIPSTQSWVITYYMPPPAVSTLSTNYVAGSAGTLSPDGLVDGLIKTNAERSGVGLLQCATNVGSGGCDVIEFVPRIAQEIDKGSSTIRADDVIVLPSQSDLYDGARWNLPLPTTWNAIDKKDSDRLRGAAALLTHVQNSND